MFMRYCLTFLLVIFLSVPALCQQKASKMETVKWLVDKINRYGLRVDVSDNRDNVSEYARVMGDRRHPVLTERLEGSRDYEEDYVHFDELLRVDTTYDATNLIPYGLILTSQTADKSTMSNMHFGTAVLRLNWDAEPDLFGRMYRAFKVLAAYNYGTEKSEAY
jgi:hypothetical protein